MKRKNVQRKAVVVNRKQTRPTASIIEATGLHGPLHVPPRQVAAMSSTQLLDLVETLACAEGARLGIASSRIIFGAEEKASDGGSDGITPRHSGKSPWLPSGVTRWQLKAGKAGQPARLREEMLDRQKKEPAATLRAKGHYVAVASGSVSGDSGRTARLEALTAAARQRRVPVSHIEVFTSETLSRWLDEFPSVAKRVLELGDVWTIDDWESRKGREHSIGFQPSSTQAQQMDELAALLDFSKDGQHHVHVVGLPGVGKTRQVLETCRRDRLRPLALYLPESSIDARRLVAALSERRSFGIIVVDETPPGDVAMYADLASSAASRLRVVTIGKALGADAGLKVLQVNPQSRDEMEKMVAAWWPEMPSEHRAFVGRFSDGFPRLARLVGQYLIENPEVTTSELLQSDPIARVIEGLLPKVARRHLYVLSVLESMGFAGEAEEQGKLVAGALGVDWLDVKATITDLRDEFGLVRVGQNYLYLSPLPLALWLARTAWETYPDELRTLRDALSDEAARALDRRLAAIGSSPGGAALFSREITRFRALVDFARERDARLWTVLAEHQPSLAIKALRRALSKASVEARLEFKDGARRTVLWYLPRLVWRRETFDDAIRCLADLSVAENETWANNSTGEFERHFQVQLGGTEVPYPERLTVLRELFDDGPAYHAMVLRALATATEIMVHRTVGAEAWGDGALRPEWRPTPAEDRAARTLAISELCALIPTASVEQKDAVALIQKTHWTLAEYGFDESLEALVSTVLARFPTAREEVRRIFDNHLARERWSKRNDSTGVETVPAVLRRLETSLKDPSLGGRLREAVGPGPWDTEGTDGVMKQLAREVLDNIPALKAELPWLTSDGAGSGFGFGVVIAELDETKALSSLLADGAHIGPDPRFWTGYFIGLAETGHATFVDDRVEAMAEGGSTKSLAFEILASLEPSQRRASIFVKLVRSGAIMPMRLRVIAHRPWAIKTDNVTFLEILDGLLSIKSVEARRTALEILGSRVHEGIALSKTLEMRASDLTTDREVYPSSSNLRWGWKEVALLLANTKAHRVASFIFALQSDRSAHFFLEHHKDAKDVLDVCIEHDRFGVWTAFAACLNPGFWSRFSIGLPKRLLVRFDADTIVEWIQEAPSERAPMIAHCLAPLFESDVDLDSRLVERYRQVEGVEEGLFSNVITGTSWGSLAGRWKALATQFIEISKRTSLVQVRKWALDCAERLTRMANTEAGREADDAIRRS
ncbi:MAG: hypothetical protein ABI672_19045 [Vicinamibacteria bacterium]